ncbi:MAG: NUDIX domain-containing protein [Bacteroidota bacterium]
MKGLKKSAVMVILQSGDQFLLLERLKPPHQGLYAPVGGKIDPYEDPNQTAIRETREETGIELEGVRYLGSLIEHAPIDYNWHCLIYTAEIPWQEPPACDEGTLRWVSLNQLDAAPLPPTDPWIYQYMLRQQVFMFNAAFDANGEMLWMREEIEGILLG